MLIKSIRLYNFRQFVGNNILLFSLDNLANVTVIMGNNASGKTTLAQAFTWCLYGNTDFQNKSMLSNSVVNKMVIGETQDAYVEIELTQGGKEYKIFTKQEYKKDNNGKIVNTTQVIRNISMKKDDGQTKIISETKADFRINEILPRELSRYFFFDGERIDKMSREIRQGKSKEFSEAVKGLLGLNAYKAALEHLNSRSPSSVIRNYNNSFDSKSNNKIAQLMVEIENCDNEIDKINNRLTEIDEYKNMALEKCNALREIIIRNEEGEKLQNDYDKYIMKLKTLNKSKLDTKGHLLKHFSENAYQFFSIKIIHNILQLMSKNDILDKGGIQDIQESTIDFLIKRGFCICGNKLEKNNEAYKTLKEVIKHIPPNSIVGPSIDQFIRECELISKTGFSFFESIENDLRLIRNYDNEYSGTEEDIKILNEKLENIKDIGQYKRDLTIYESEIIKLEEEHDSCLIEKNNNESEKSHKETERDQLALRDENNKNIELYRAYAQYIYSILENDYAAKEDEVRKTLELEINSIFKLIFDGGITLDLDDSYHIHIKINETFNDSDTSAGQNFTVIFAFISGIIKMAKIKNNGIASTEPYPLVMDAPLSSFDKKRIEKICNTLPDIAEQIIIFIKDTDGEYAEKYLSNRIGKKYELSKTNEIETEIKEYK